MSVNWYENTPEKGVLCKENSSGSIVRIIGKTDHINFDMVYDDSIRRHVYDPEELTPLTAAEWWQFAPWQDMKDAPRDGSLMFIMCENREFHIGCYDDDGDYDVPINIYGDTELTRAIKWLPLPKVQS